MVVEQFSWSRTPTIIFGTGSLTRLGEAANAFGKTAIVVTGARSLKQSGRLEQVLRLLDQSSVQCHVREVRTEPSPTLVNEILRESRGHDADVVIAIGGGSALDAGKAISAMLPHERPVQDYLEGVGTLKHDGRKVPFIAVPTTAGTGSEATVNAVLSHVGPDGYKASLRHPNLAPDVALVDPELALSCPREVTAACGMDALTQLIEAYVSTQSSPLTDAIAESGLLAVRENLIAACRSGSTDLSARTGMAYASLLSGLALANAGLGVVHGLAGIIGGLSDVPHGVVCGTLVAAATRMNIEKLGLTGGIALRKYAAVGRLFGADRDNTAACCNSLIDTLDNWTHELELPRLGEYGLRGSFLQEIAQRASNKNNPVKLNSTEMASLLSKRA